MAVRPGVGLPLAQYNFTKLVHSPFFFFFCPPFTAAPQQHPSKMVIKTQLCAFSESRIYPGHGSMCCRRDGQTFWLSSKKSKSMYNQKKKPQKIAWTQAWRRLHKKNVDNRQKKKVSDLEFNLLDVGIKGNKDTRCNFVATNVLSVRGGSF